MLWEFKRSARFTETREEPAWSYRIEHRNSRHVQRQLQGTANRDGALESLVEVFRRIVAIADRPVLDQCLRVNDAILKAKPIDKGF